MVVLKNAKKQLSWQQCDHDTFRVSTNILISMKRERKIDIDKNLSSDCIFGAFFKNTE